MLPLVLCGIWNPALIVRTFVSNSHSNTLYFPLHYVYHFLTAGSISVVQKGGGSSVVHPLALDSYPRAMGPFRWSPQSNQIVESAVALTQLIRTRLYALKGSSFCHPLLISYVTGSNTNEYSCDNSPSWPWNSRKSRAHARSRLSTDRSPLNNHGSRRTCYRLLLSRYCRECGSRLRAAKNVFDWIMHACFFLGCKMDIYHKESKLRLNHWSSLLVNKKPALARRTHKHHGPHIRAWRHGCPIPMWMKLTTIWIVVRSDNLCR